MKTIAAVALADGLTRVQVSLAGILVAACVLRRALDAKISSTASERATLLDDDDDELP